MTVCDICGRAVARDDPGFGLCNHCKSRIQLHDEYMEKGYKMSKKLDELEKRYPILKYFQYEHLPPALHEVSSPFCALAYGMAMRETKAYAEVAAGLRKLLEAKDCAVRAALP